MNEEQLTPLDAEMLALLANERVACPPDGARERVMNRLASTIPSLGGSGAPPAAGGLGGGTIASIVGALIVGGGVGALIQSSVPHADVARPSFDRIVYMTLPAAAPAQPLASAAAPSSATLAPAPAAVSPLEALAAERGILDRAKRALARGAPDDALEAIAEHARRFPRGALSEEREALRVQALVRAGRYAEARARADEFRRRAPQSLFMPAVDSAMASIP